MADYFGLLLDAVLRQLPSGFQAVIITAKRVTPEWQEYALLMLPYMDQLVNKQPLQAKIAVAKIFAKQVVLGMEPEMAIGCHRYLFGVKPEPFAVVDAHIFQGQSIAEHRLR